MKVRMNFGALKKIKKNIEREFGSHADASELVDDIVRVAGQRWKGKAIKRTPVDTGQLRMNWEVSEPRKRGFNHFVDLENGVEYASYVEYGHSQEVGRYVPQINKRLVKDWVDGHFMAKNSKEEVLEELPEIAEERMIKKFLEIFP